MKKMWMECDICGTRYESHETMELQEFTSIRYHGGYDSVFGDTSLVECDICQHCLKKLLVGYIRVDGKVLREKPGSKEGS